MFVRQLYAIILGRMLLAAITWLFAVPGLAQISNETVINNHRTASTFSRTYTPSAGSDRVVIAIVFSEYDRDQESTVTSATLGGVPMQSLGTIQGTAAKRNRLSAYILREASLPTGPSTFRVTYGSDPSASLIYLATVLNIDQAAAADPARSFTRFCTRSNWNKSGTMTFDPVNAMANDYVFSFVGTGDNGTFTTFQNGASEFFDQRVFSPGFSFAGGVQVPLTSQAIGGTAFISEGCDRRPATFQLVLRPQRGTDAVLSAPLARQVGLGVEIEVADADRNTRTAAVDEITVTIVNRTTGETETIVLLETGPSTGIFRGTLPTQNGASGQSQNGVMRALPGHILRATYADTLTSDGARRDVVGDTRMTATSDPARLSVRKSSALALAPGSSGFHLPGEEVLYTITVSNIGDGPSDDMVLVIDSLPDEIAFFNGDAIANDGDNAAVRGETGESGLVFSPSSDLRFSNAATPPTDFSQCSYAASSGYDPQVRHVCLRPRGRFLPGDPDPEITFLFRARIR